MHNYTDADVKLHPSAMIHLFWDCQDAITATTIPGPISLPGPELLGVMSAIEAKMIVLLALFN